MLLPLALALTLGAPAHASAKKEARKAARVEHKAAEIDPEIITDHSAYVVKPRQWRMELVNFDYGLTDTIQLRTAPALWLLGPNAFGKV